MTYRILNNKKNGTFSVLFTASNTGFIVAGNTTNSNVALTGENLAGATVLQAWFGSPSGNAAYWQLKRGANTIMVFDSTAYIDFRGNGLGLDVDMTANVAANLIGTTVGTLIVEFKKQPANNQFVSIY